MNIDVNKKYELVIHTDSYAGNFERELCAYVFDVVGECGVGSEHVGETNLFKGLIDASYFTKEHGFTSPVDISRTPETKMYNSLNIGIVDLNAVIKLKELSGIIWDRVRYYCEKKRIKILGIEFKTITVTSLEEFETLPKQLTLGNATRVWGEPVDCGDGSVFVKWHLSEGAAEFSADNRDRGWGEDCTFSIETYAGSDVHQEACENYTEYQENK